MAFYIYTRNVFYYFYTITKFCICLNVHTWDLFLLYEHHTVVSNIFNIHVCLFLPCVCHTMILGFFPQRKSWECYFLAIFSLFACLNGPVKSVSFDICSCTHHTLSCCCLNLTTTTTTTWRQQQLDDDNLTTIMTTWRQWWDIASAVQKCVSNCK